MPSAKDRIERARMFEERAERASDPISRQHYREMAAHYCSLSVEHQELTSQTRIGALKASDSSLRMTPNLASSEFNHLPLRPKISGPYGAG